MFRYTPGVILQKTFIVLAISILLLVLFRISVSAYTLNPSTGNVTVGQTVTVQILANPGNPGVDDSADIYIQSTGPITITGAALGSSSTTSFGQCSGNTLFNSSEVCIVYGNTAGIAVGEVMATFTFVANATGPISLSVGTTGAVYSGDGGNSSNTVLTGSLASYSAVEGSTDVGAGGKLPDTSLITADNYLLILGVGMILLGVMLNIMYPRIRLSIINNRINSKINARETFENSVIIKNK